LTGSILRNDFQAFSRPNQEKEAPLETLLADLRFGLRSLARQPVLCMAALATLGLGVGATTALFSALDGIVLRPLPYREPDQLVTLWETKRAEGLLHERLSPVNFLDYRALDAFSDAAAWWTPQTVMTDEAREPVRVATVETSANLFSVLGVGPRLGRDFEARDGLFGSQSEVIISDRLWRSRFGARPELLGTQIDLDGRPHTLVGVMPAGFHFPGKTDVWQLLAWNLAQHSRGAHFMEAVARLKSGRTRAQVEQELGALTARLQKQFPGTNRDWGVRAVALDREVVGVFRPALMVLFGAVSFLLLLACANVANLLLARAGAREREVAVRAALGAGSGRLLRQFFTESLLLGGAGALLGLALAYLSVRLLIVSAPVEIPRLDEVSPNHRVFGFAALLGLLTTIAFGLVPALDLARTRGSLALRESGRGAGGSPARRRARRFLVVAEVAISAMLLTGAGLLLRSFLRLLDQKPGFEPDSVTTFKVDLPNRRGLLGAGNWRGVSQFFSDLTESLRQSPSVQAAGASGFLPLEPGWRMSFRVRGRPAPSEEDEPDVQYVTVTEGFFETLGVPLLRGRLFRESDDQSSPGVVVINEEMARRFWKDEDPLGDVILSQTQGIGPLGRLLLSRSEYEVVGVVASFRNASLEREAEPALYLSHRQFPYKDMHLVLKARGSPAEVAALARELVRRLDPSLPAPEVRTLSAVLDEARARPRFIMTLMLGFSVLALLLAAIGLYGVLSYAVSQRSREIGIRVALGAPPGNILNLVLAEGLALTLIGLGLGLIGAFLLTGFMHTLLFGVTPRDALAQSAACGLVVGVALIASYLPARRAARLDPLAALRIE